MKWCWCEKVRLLWCKTRARLSPANLMSQLRGPFAMCWQEKWSKIHWLIALGINWWIGHGSPGPQSCEGWPATAHPSFNLWGMGTATSGQNVSFHQMLVLEMERWRRKKWLRFISHGNDVTLLRITNLYMLLPPLLFLLWHHVCLVRLRAFHLTIQDDPYPLHHLSMTRSLINEQEKMSKESCQRSSISWSKEKVVGHNMDVCFLTTK